MVDLSLDELDLTEMSRADLYDMIEAQASQLLAMKGALEGVRSFLASAPLESGHCCCGSPIEGHGFGDGHSPVDELQYAAHNQIDRIDALLSASAADKIAEGLRDACRPNQFGEQP